MVLMELLFIYVNYYIIQKLMKKFGKMSSIELNKLMEEMETNDKHCHKSGQRMKRNQIESIQMESKQNHVHTQ